MSTLDSRKNFAIVTVSTGYSDVDTSITLSSGHGARLPDPATDGPCNLVWFNWTDYKDPADDPNKEIVRLTGRSGDVLTVTRAQEGTSASSKNGYRKVYKIILAVTAKMIDDIESELDSKIDSSEKGAANGVAELDASGLIPADQLPALSITDTFVVLDEAEMLALDAQKGDVAVRVDLSKSFILSGSDPSILANWTELKTPTDAVTSVNGLTGSVTLTTTNISEGTNLYFTNSRAISALSGTLAGYWKNNGTSTPTANWSIEGYSFTASALYGTSLGLKDENTATYGFLGLEDGVYTFAGNGGSIARVAINSFNMQDPTNYGYNGFGYVYLDSDIYQFRNSSENLAGIALSNIRLSDDFAGGLGSITLYDGAYTFLNSLGALGNISVANLGFDGGYVGQYSSFAYGSAGINADGTAYFEVGNFAFNQYNPLLTTDGTTGIYIYNNGATGTDIKGVNWQITYDGEFYNSGNSIYWLSGGQFYAQNSVTTLNIVASTSSGLIFKNSGSTTALTIGASGTTNALFAGNIEVSNSNPQLVLTSGTNSATAGLVRWRTTGGSEYCDHMFDASANIYKMTYGATTIISYTSSGTTFNSPSSGTGGIVTANYTANTWTNASLVNKIIGSSVTLNQSGTSGFDIIDFSITQSAVGSGEKNLIRFNVNGSGRFTVDYLGRVAINKSIPATILGMVDIVTDGSLSDTVPSIVAGKAVTSGISRGASFRNLTGTTGQSMIEIAGISSGSARPSHILVDDLGDMSIATGSTTYGTLGTVRIKVLSGGNIQLIENNHIVLGTSVGTKIGTATNQKLGFWNATPVVQPSAYTQTYATATKTHSNLTSADIGAFTGGLVGFLDAAERDNIRTQYNALKADVTNLKQFVNSIVDDLQAIGLVG